MNAQSVGAVEYAETHKECFRYDIKPSDGEVPVLELSGMWSTPLLVLLPGPLRKES